MKRIWYALGIVFLWSALEMLEFFSVIVFGPFEYYYRLTAVVFLAFSGWCVIEWFFRKEWKLERQLSGLTKLVAWMEPEDREECYIRALKDQAEAVVFCEEQHNNLLHIAEGGSHDNALRESRSTLNEQKESFQDLVEAGKLLVNCYGDTAIVAHVDLDPEQLAALQKGK